MELLSSVILCGGQSRRMGRDKALLLWKGQDLLDVIAGALSELGEVFLSVDSERRLCGKPYSRIVDRYPNCGPLGGICSVLPQCRTPLLFVVSCDMPFVTAEMGRALCERLESEAGAAVPREASGRVHPLCAVYRRETVAILLRKLRMGNFRMRDALEHLSPSYVPTDVLPGGSRSLCNVNTIEEYRALLEAEKGRRLHW